MGRQARIKVDNRPGWYHIYSHTSGDKNDRPLQLPGAMEKLLAVIRYYAERYFVRLPAYALMGNHYHLVVRFEKPRKLSNQELRKKALQFYDEKKIKNWKRKDWRRFNRRLFDLSEFMRNVQGVYATWHNRTFERRGPLWRERFHSNLLEDGEAVLRTLSYVDLNPVGARMVPFPEDWLYCSWAERVRGNGKWLMPLSEAVFMLDRDEYQAILIERGDLDMELPEGSEKWKWYPKLTGGAGHCRRGADLKRQGWLERGLVTGQKKVIQAWIDGLSATGYCSPKRRPVRQTKEGLYTLRAQRKA